MASDKQLTFFQIKIFCGKSTQDTEERSYSESADKWEEYRCIKMPGFDGTQTIRLDDFWLTVFSDQPEHLQMEVIGLESIAKYSGVQQLKETFTIVAELTYQ